MGYYKDKWEALPEKTRLLLQVACGILLGVISIALVFLPGSFEGGSVFSVNSLIALAVAFIVPRVLEGAVGGPLRKLRSTLLIAMLVSLVLLSAVLLIFKPSWMTAF